MEGRHRKRGKQEGAGFAPEFVIEVRSLEQRARMQREKMEESIANGVLLGWLIDPLEKTVTIYRPGREPEVFSNRLKSPARDRGGICAPNAPDLHQLRLGRAPRSACAATPSPNLSPPTVANCLSSQALQPG